MARASARPSARSGRATPVVLLLLLAIAAAAWFAVVPDFFRARDGVRVELAARAAARCDFAAREYARRGWVESAADVTPEMVVSFYERVHQPPPEWPAAADLSTLDFSDTNGVSVAVRVRGGARTVRASDRLEPPGADADPSGAAAAAPGANAGPGF